MNEEHTPIGEPIASSAQQIPSPKPGWKHHFTTVTPLSKALAILLFTALPFVGFWLGMNHSTLFDSFKEHQIEQPPFPPVTESPETPLSPMSEIPVSVMPLQRTSVTAFWPPKHMPVVRTRGQALEVPLLHMQAGPIHVMRTDDRGFLYALGPQSGTRQTVTAYGTGGFTLSGFYGANEDEVLTGWDHGASQFVQITPPSDANVWAPELYEDPHDQTLWLSLNGSLYSRAGGQDAWQDRTQEVDAYTEGYKPWFQKVVSTDEYGVEYVYVLASGDVYNDGKGTVLQYDKKSASWLSLRPAIREAVCGQADSCPYSLDLNGFLIVSGDSVWFPLRTEDGTVVLYYNNTTKTIRRLSGEAVTEGMSALYHDVPLVLTRDNKHVLSFSAEDVTEVATLLAEEPVVLGVVGDEIWYTDAADDVADAKLFTINLDNGEHSETPWLLSSVFSDTTRILGANDAGQVLMMQQTKNHPWSLLLTDMASGEVLSRNVSTTTAPSLYFRARTETLYHNGYFVIHVVDTGDMHRNPDAGAVYGYHPETGDMDDITPQDARGPYSLVEYDGSVYFTNARAQSSKGLGMIPFAHAQQADTWYEWNDDEGTFVRIADGSVTVPDELLEAQYQKETPHAISYEGLMRAVTLLYKDGGSSAAEMELVNSLRQYRDYAPSVAYGSAERPLVVFSKDVAYLDMGTLLLTVDLSE